MYKKRKPTVTTIRQNTAYVGETLEQKVNRIVNNKEPIKDGAPLIYTDRKDGVKPEMDIRTDRFELAVEAMDMVNKDKIAKRNERMADRAKEGMKAEEKTETKVTQKNEISGAEPAPEASK